VILVPSRQDFRTHGLHTELWWQPTDYLHFKNEAKEEVTQIMADYHVDTITAMNYLFMSSHQELLDAGPPPPEEESILSSSPPISSPLLSCGLGDQSPSTITRRPSLQHHHQHHSLQHQDQSSRQTHHLDCSSEDDCSNKTINFLDIRTKLSAALSLSHDFKPIHPLALLAT
jgi:hypothetical protein